MKRIIFLVAALLTVFSGVAAVTAYEGHMVDVKAHLENALMVEKTQVDFGTVFPQEKLETQFKVGLSESYRAQTRYSSVAYNMYWEPKLIAGHPNALDPDADGEFLPIWPYILVQNDGTDFPKTAFVDKGNGIWLIGAATLNRTSDTCDEIHFIIDPPVFDKWYNKATDDLLGKTPSGILTNGVTGTADDQYVVTVETAACGFTAEVPKTDLGSNFKIQVTDIIPE